MPGKIVKYRLQVRFRQPFTVPGTDLTFEVEAKTTVENPELEPLKAQAEQILGVIRADGRDVTHAYIMAIDNGGNAKPVKWEPAA